MIRKLYRTILAIQIFVVLPISGFGAYCTPNANCSLGVEINNFTFNTISNLNSGGSNCNTTSYINTNLSTTVIIGNKYAITMQGGSSFAQGFGVWIDYNQDDDFNDVDEFIYASPNASNNLFSDSIIISTSALTGSTRMRVRSKFNQTINANQSCNNFNWGETEDYTVILQANTQPPVANFSSDTTFTCSGTINFTDQSLNIPTSWIWDFGDGNTSNLQHPSHSYLVDGTYTVSLTVSNNFGADSITFTNYIVVTIVGTITASCTPATTGYCCQMGIYNVLFESINNSSSNGNEGYMDFTCSGNTIVTMGQTYNIAVETGPNYMENVVAWIDYNNDGSFSGSELAFSSLGILTNHTGTITLPNNPVLGTYLRMRIGSDWLTNPQPSPCTDVQYGQFEDYSVFIQPDTMPPVSNFIADATMTCNGLINFTDLSTLSPTTWFWDFGDGSTDTVQHPTHNYTIDGTYSVKLITSNQYGTDSITFSNYITVTSNGPSPASCTPSTSSYCCGFGITNVAFNTINSTTTDGSAGYEDLSCSFGTNVIEGQTYSISIDMSSSSPGLNNVKVWLDYNNDGILDDVTELVFSATSVLVASGNITISPGAVLNAPLRLRVSADYDFEPDPTPCNNQVRGQTEDYSITISPNTNPPVANFNALSTISCDGSVSFTDLSSNVPTFWLWDFGDGNTSNLQNPIHAYSTNGEYTVTLTVSNSNGSDTITIQNFITIAIGSGPIASSCTPSTLSYCCGYGIYNVNFNGINNSTGNGSDGYVDYSCTVQSYVIEGQSYSISVLTGISNPQDTRIWIDLNNDGVLDDNTERVFTADDAFNPTGSINIPIGTVKDTALRMRVSSDFSGSGPDPCTSLWYGQAEDYAIVVGLPPVSNFSSSDSLFCEGNCIDFTDLSTNNPTTWSWTFTGASPNISTDQNPSNICYSSPGTYPVKLIVSNSYGTDVKNLNTMITILSCPPPVADFGASITSICRGECISFSDLTSNTPNSWSWTFTGSNTSSSNLQNPSDICYDTAGTYPVTLIASNGNGSDSLTKAGYITVTSCIPTASFSVSNTNGCVGACMSFMDQSTNSPTSWAWSFPGGNPDTSSAQNPIDICYPDTGTFTVSLISSNLSGTDSITMVDLISINNCPPPSSNFVADDMVICSGECINFTDQSINANTWEWTFNGATPGSSTDQNPQNICFNGPPGEYQVTLKTTNLIGADSITKSILVDSIVAGLIVDDTLYQNLPGSFTDNSINNPISWTWDFGDGNTTNMQNPIYIYTSLGQYTVSLIVENSNGCIDTASKTIVVIAYIGSSEIEIRDLINIYPNPTDGKLSVDGLMGEQISIKVENILGEIQALYNLSIAGNKNFEIDLSEYRDGIYFISFTSARYQLTKKIIKN